ncbi:MULTISPECIES: RsmB/NOP family class I SAM-dependent RNA methyltransferase [unclassified Azospirillum]|uniref:RsmB/NOP family class I SAM-dependent RNA methyltransferase n=1 Tax=unclassified Azospirillum TaxID=2630922 RepID=UPI000B692224|nr:MULTISPECIES: RsmB/NOP family class I SAM-dependent RNA methyltransferase [unclassified Azospirillum]SNS88782.1 16S rRNA (cytosine967-C5)-methyltransferase [Azospirillum sp. RU38E]SNT05940.1 16S rRNA (cytosine967-C5)-methyltransferase [Azospirillum sp. RU37A]
MTPAARLATAVDLLAEVMDTPRPADAVTSAFFRARRYIGAKDRADIAQTVYGVMRRWARLHWWLERVNHMPDPRALVLADCILAGGRTADAVAGLFNGAKFAPAPLSDRERKLIRALDTHTLDHPSQTEEVQGEVPDWAAGPMRAAFGDRFLAEMVAMLGEAPLDLRTNPVKGTRADALKALVDAGYKAVETPLSPVGVRLATRAPVMAMDIYKNGLIEIQDEGSQLVAFLADAKPGMQVVDFCAGAGGKTLAIAAMMENKGRVIASDVLAGRLERAKERFRRAGLHNIETRALKNERDPWVKRHKGKFDRVVIDAPCSGTGTWRRNPDARWRPLGPGLTELMPLQASILDSAARLARPGGRVIYATCSLLPEENEHQVEAFLASHPDFTLVPVADAWPEAWGKPPVTTPMLRLTPAQHDTDGFFAAVLERRADVAEAADETAAEPAEAEAQD